jgi:hypothetical protein
MPGEQDKQDLRHKFDQPDQAKVEHVAGQCIHLPADGHGNHLKAAGGEHPSKPEREKRAVVAQ